VVLLPIENNLNVTVFALQSINLVLKNLNIFPKMLVLLLYFSESIIFLLQFILKLTNIPQLLEAIGITDWIRLARPFCLSV